MSIIFSKYSTPDKLIARDQNPKVKPAHGRLASGAGQF
jgi:hypothetical protein